MKEPVTPIWLCQSPEIKERDCIPNRSTSYSEINERHREQFEGGVGHQRRAIVRRQTAPRVARGDGDWNADDEGNDDDARDNPRAVQDPRTVD